MESRFLFTPARVDALPPAERRAIYYDTRQRWLALFVTPTARTFYFVRRSGGKTRQIKIGTFPAMPIDVARQEAARHGVQVDTTGATARPTDADPAGGWTVGEILDWYLRDYAKPRKKASTYAKDEKNARVHLAPLAGVPAATLSKSTIRDMHARIGKASGLVVANQVLYLLRTVWNKAVAHDKIALPNPTAGIEPFKERSRDRRLMPSEAEAFLAAVLAEPNAEIRDFVLLSLFTGARRANVCGMRWDQLDLKARTWRIPETKSGTPQELPLVPQAIAILESRKAAAQSEWVLASIRGADHLKHPQTGWTRILERAGIPKGSLHIHDLRRTHGSWMVDTGASLAVIGRALHHQDQETTAIYARLSLDPVREAQGRAVDAFMRAANPSAAADPPPRPEGDPRRARVRRGIARRSRPHTT